MEDACLAALRCTAAAEVAVDMMWQEDLSHRLCRALSWQACHLRLTELLSLPADEPEEPAAIDEEEVMFSVEILRFWSWFIFVARMKFSNMQCASVYCTVSE